MQVTECREHVLELRRLVTAASAGEAWDLRCFLREAMIAFIRGNFPDRLPRFRAELGSAGAAPRETPPALQPTRKVPA